MARLGTCGAVILAAFGLAACQSSGGVSGPMTESEQCWWVHTCFDVAKTADQRAATIVLDYKGSYEPFAVQVRTSVSGMDGTWLENETFFLQEPRRIPILDVKAGTTGSWDWRWSFSHHPGVEPAVHDDSVLYRLPYRDGETYEVIQGYGGNTSHTGDNFYSIDWAMPVGTAVLAARDGIVVSARGESNRKGRGWDNHVIIRHGDGTYAWYLHLQQNGVTVQPGQSVTAGSLIGYSGDTGFSSRAHLHFQVSALSAAPDKFYASFPTRFWTADGEVAQLRKGGRYKGVSLPSG